MAAAGDRHVNGGKSIKRQPNRSFWFDWHVLPQGLFHLLLKTEHPVEAPVFAAVVIHLSGLWIVRIRVAAVEKLRDVEAAAVQAAMSSAAAEHIH